MPVVIAAAIFFGLTPVGQVFTFASRMTRRLFKVLDAYDLGRLREEQTLDLNSARDRWRRETRNPSYPLFPYRVDAVFHESQGWAAGEMLLYIDEWVMLQQFLQLDAHNRTHGPDERIPCGIEGRRIAHVGRERLKSPQLCREAEANARRPGAEMLH